MEDDMVCRLVKNLIAHYQYKLDNADKEERIFYSEFISSLKDLLIELVHC